ncbi:MAG: S-layer homology domain-containing protein [Oscillospiraceae bacterium]|nr:S-layer homology domain-containing protein [Oscillospiraceae bacterium]
MADLRSADNGSYISYIAGTGEYEPDAAGMYTGTLDLTSKSYSITYGCSISYFQPELYSEWYASLTDEVSDSVAFIAALESADADTSGSSGSSSGSGSASSSTHSGSSSSGTTTTTTTTVTDVTDTSFNTTPIEVTAEAVMTEEEATAAVEAMTDVEADAYYTNAIAWALEYGITTGTSDSTFDPSAECTRAQIVTFLYRMAGSPAVEGGTNVFADVDSDAYYYDAILWAIENGITRGQRSWRSPRRCRHRYRTRSRGRCRGRCRRG